MQDPIDLVLVVPDEKLPVAEQGAGDIGLIVGHNGILMDRRFTESPKI